MYILFVIYSSRKEYLLVAFKGIHITVLVKHVVETPKERINREKQMGPTFCNLKSILYYY